MNDRIAIRTGKSFLFLQKDELDWAESEGKNVRLHIGKESLLLRISITSLQSQLNQDQFLRIHRCTIVNIHRIRRIEPRLKGYQLTLQDGTQLMMSRREDVQGLLAVKSIPQRSFHIPLVP